MPQTVPLIRERHPKSVHPPEVLEYIPREAFKPRDQFSEKSYDGLTDESPYSHYAWAFLRRNRFYQAMLDGVPGARDLERWGLKPTAGVAATFGLIDPKPYWESYDAGAPLRWYGIHNFAKRHTRYGWPQSNQSQIEFDKTQVQIVFDIDALLDPATAIHAQIQIAEQILLQRAAQAGFYKPQSERQIKKEAELLRLMLRVADLLSPQRLDPDSAPEWEIDHPRRDPMQAVVEKLPASVLKGRKAKKEKVREIADDAFVLIYQWRALEYLKWDDWTGLASPEPSTPQNIRKNVE